MARRRAYNVARDNEAAMGHCVRSFRNDIAVWWEEAKPSENSPKRLKAITTSWKEFEITFRRAWKIKATRRQYHGWRITARSQTRGLQIL
jgi:hypothetical protein